MVWKSTEQEIIESDGATLILINQNSGHTKPRIRHEKNGGTYLNPVISLGCRYVHLINNKAKIDCLMSEFFEKGKRSDIKNGAISNAIEISAMKLAYIEIKGIDIKDINTHSLRSRRQMHCTSWDTKTGRYKKWEYGGQKNSRNTSQTNYIHFTKSYQRT